MRFRRDLKSVSVTSTTKYALVGGVSVLALLGFRKAVRTATAGDGLRVGVDFVKLHQIGLTSTLLRASVRLKNPTAGTIKIKRPFVELLFQGSVVGSSTAVANNDTITVPPGETTFDLWPRISYFSVAAPLVAVLRSLFAGATSKPVRMGARITSRVNDLVPIDETFEVDVQ